MISTEPTQSVAVFGLGYVGCVTAGCLAQLGLRVYGVDHDEFKIGNIMEGRAPFHEEGLDGIIRDAVAAGLLTASTNSAAALEFADIAMICVGTPSAPNGNLGTEQLERVFAELSRGLSTRGRRLIVAVRSTVFPGTIEELGRRFFPASADVSLVSCPEFLREGVAVRDFREPSLLVVGGSDPRAVDAVSALFAPLGQEVACVSLRTAEMIKYCCNAFHALKIAFANEVGALCDAMAVSPEEVMDTLCRDVRLNISSAYLKPGFAFGGSCLPKDLRALTYRALRMDLKLPLLDAVLPSNERHLERAISLVLNSGAQRIGVVGLAFKENTDDLRESPIIAAIEQWTGKGRDVRVYDPHVKLDAIYGSNLRFVMRSLPHIHRLLAAAPAEVLDWADAIVISHKPSPTLARLIEAADKPVFDLARVIPEPARAAKVG